MAKLFKLEERGATVRKEVIGGITTFLAMAYILAVNPNMLAAAGLPAGGVFTATAIHQIFHRLFLSQYKIDICLLNLSL